MSWMNEDYSGEEYELVQLADRLDGDETLTIEFVGDGREDTHEEFGDYVNFRGLEDGEDPVQFNTQSSRLLRELKKVAMEHDRSLDGVMVEIERDEGEDQFDVTYAVEVVEG